MIHVNVLSLFDGLSCGRIALERSGFQVNNYFSSEIDKYAIQITQKNYPDTMQLGDVMKWDNWSFPSIDLLIGGSPCTHWSVARKNREITSDGIGFELFKTYAGSLKKHKPKYFLYENNYSIHKNIKNEITKYLGVEPIMLNSAAVSAQNRRRLYWTNIQVDDLEDKGILLKDVLLENPSDKLIHTEKALEYMNRKTKDGRNHWDFAHHSDSENEKSATVVANFFKGVPYNVLKDGECIRKFDPVECERLQTIPDNYTEGVSNTQRYKMIGNGWTVDVIAHILKNIN